MIHQPPAPPQVYTAVIPEDIGPNTTVLRVSATDLDFGPNGVVMYSLGNDTQGLFEINSVTGEVVTSGAFDRERTSAFSFTVVASDNGTSGPRNTTARLDVTVTDVNDNAPVFTTLPYTASLPLSTGPDVSVLTVTATDTDDGPNGQVAYSLLDDGTDSLTYFRLDGNTGELYTRARMITAQGHYSLKVTATDKALDPQARMTSTGNLETI